VNALEQWLSVATHELTPESAERVRGEIAEHYQSAIASGVSEADAVVALGDPKAANHEYRKVLLTTREALMAPTYTQPRRVTLRSVLSSTFFFAALIWFFSSSKNSASVVPVLTAIWTLGPLRWLLQANHASDRTILHVSYVHGVFVVALAWWYQGWIAALAYGVVVFPLRWALEAPKIKVLRKLASGQTYRPPSNPDLTQLEAIFLNTLRSGDPSQKYALPFIFVALVALTFWQPQYFAGFLAMLTMRFTVPYVVNVYTPDRSRWFRIAKWTFMALAAGLPVALGAKAGWVAAPYVAFLFLILDVKRISLRRKLPVEQWPKELYL
jgi:uncharacterized membrane protein